MASCPSECKVLRIMLLGCSGVGKSATANAILGTETFKETETIQCEIQNGRVEGRNISVIDTPGINNTSLTPEQWRTELKKGLLLSSPGPHVFLLVTKVRKFSEEEGNAVKWIVENFGEEAPKFTMILFIGREEMTQRQLVKFSEDVRTKDLISCFQGGYCVINSKREVNRAQISKLLEEIEAIVQQNGGQVYTQDMYEAVDKMRTGGKTQKKEEIGKGHENQPKPNQDTSLEVQKVDSVIGVNVKCGIVIPPKKQEESVKSLSEKKGEMAAKFVTENFKIQEETRKERERKKWEEERGATGGVQPDPGESSTHINTQINSKREVNQAQISKLLEEIEAIVQQNGGQVYTQDMYEAVDRMRTGGMTQKKEEMGKGHENQPKPNQDTSLAVRKEDSVIGDNVKCGNVIPPRKQEESVKSLPEKKGEMEAKFVQPDPSTELRIVLLGKTGSGKSAMGNTILNGKYFEVKPSPVLVTRQCEVKRSERITVIDTPGIFNTLLTPDELREQMDRCMTLSVPGPHVFLLVVKLGRFTEEEKKTVKWMKNNFGKHAFFFTMILFTHADQLGENTLDDILAESADLRKLLNCCGNRYYAFNNNDPSPSQVENLMQKINNMVMLNGNRYYTEEMYRAQGNVGGDEMLAVGLSVVTGIIIATAGLAALGLLLRK